MSTPRPNQPRRLASVVLFATIFLDFMGFSVLIPVLPIHLESLGATSYDVGVILALYVIAMVLFLPFWGWVSDRLGRRPVLLVCLLGTAVSFAIMVPAESLGWFYAARVLQGFFGASVGTAQAYMTDITSDEDRAGGIGTIGAAAGLGAVFGPAIGGGLYAGDSALPFLAPAALAILAFVGAALYLPESRPPADGAGIRGLLRALIPTPVLVFFDVHSHRTRVYLYLFLHVFAGFAALEAMFPFFASERLDWTVWEVGLFISYIGVVMALVQGLLIPPLTRWLGESVLVVVGLAMTGLGMIGVSVADSVLELTLLGSGVAIGYGLAYPAFTSLYSRACATREETGAFMAHSTAMTQTGRGIGFIWAGLAAHYLGIGSPFLLGGLGVLAGLAIFLLALPALLPRPSETGEDHIRV